MISDFVVFLAVSVCLHNGLGFAFNIGIVPDSVNGLVHNNVSITCRLDASDTDVTEVVYMNVFRGGKAGQKAIAVFRHDSKLTIAEGTENRFQAHGEMTKSVRDSYLTVDLSTPNMDDSGEYSCLLYYLDHTSVVKEKKTKAKLTVTSEGMISTLRHLGDEVSALKTELSLERSKSRDTEAELKRSRDMENELQGKIKQIQVKDNTIVTFTAYGTSTNSLAKGRVMVFGDVTTNEGQCYNGTTGVFTAPVAGYYVFHVLITLHRGQHMIYNLKSSNGQILQRIYVGDKDWERGDGASCLAKLEVGEEIKLVADYLFKNPAILYNRRYCQFSGYLLKVL